MGRNKYTTETFIEASKKVHGDKFSYEKTVFTRQNEHVVITCQTHGDIKIIPSRHLMGADCLQCSYEDRAKNRTFSTGEFIKRSKNIHGDTYDYSKTKYAGRFKYSTIICKKHGEFKQHPGNHLQGRGCKKCADEKNGKEKRITLSEFINRSHSVHGYLFDYSLVKYRDAHTKVKIVCKHHGVFEQTPNHHILGDGCPVCRGMVRDIGDFIEKADRVHMNRYDYSISKYTSSVNKIEIICNDHGVFRQTPRDHISGYGCPSCSLSKGELSIKRCLDKIGVKYEQQYKIDGCRNILPLPFDFALKLNDLCLIEYNGRQHYEPVERFGGEESLKKVIKNDSIKSKYCKINKIPLLIIPHWEKDIDKATKRFVYANR